MLIVIYIQLTYAALSVAQEMHDVIFETIMFIFYNISSCNECQ